MKSSIVLDKKIFRHIFGRKESAPILAPFLNAIAGFEGEKKIKECEVVKQYDTGTGKEGAIEFHYLHVKDEQMRHYCIDLRLRKDPYTTERAFCNLIHLCTKAVKEEVALHDSFRGIGISFIDFTVYPGNEYHHVFRLMEVETKALLTDSREIIFLELPKFTGEAVENLSTPVEKWLHFLKYSHKYMGRGEELPVQLREEEGIQQAVDVFREGIGYHPAQA